MEPHKIFYNFLKLSYPALAERFKKTKNGQYTTCGNFKKEGHRFVYNTTEQIITHIFIKPYYLGCEYGKKIASESVRVIITDTGFKTVRI